MSDPFDLERFVAAQDAHGTYDRALSELRAGRKTSHWMWFVFPQLRGLGRSPAAQEYGIAGLAEARAYLAHPTLGPRLRACAEAMLDAARRGAGAEDVLGGIDALKLRSSMTLFARAAAAETAAARAAAAETADAGDAPDPTPFHAVLAAFYDGAEDSATLERLGADGGAAT